MGLEHEAKAWREAQAREAQARDKLIECVRGSVALGMSEYAIAKEVGVTRLTVRSWLGKGHK